MTDQDNLIQTGLRLFGAISYLILTLIAFVANLLLLIVMYRGRKELLKFPFFTIALNMLIGDMLNLIFVMMVVAVPTTFAGQSIYSGTVLSVFTSMDTINYHSNLWFSFLLTLNRLCVFIIRPLDTLFTGRKLKILLCIIWIYAIGFMLALTFAGCNKTFFTQGFYVQYICAPNVTVQNLLNKYAFYPSSYFPPVMLIIYLLIFIEIKFHITYYIQFGKKLHVKAKHSNNEINILLQSFLICLVLELENFAFNAVGWFGKPVGDIAIYISFARTWAIILLNAIHSIVIFVFNTLAKRKLKELFYKKINNQVAAVLSVSKKPQSNALRK